MTNLVDTFGRLRNVVAESFDIDPNLVFEHSNADDIEGWDSLSHATLVLRLERIFGIDLPPLKAAEAQSLGELANLIRSCEPRADPATEAKDVFLGTDGTTLFHRDHDAVEQVTGHLQFTALELEHWVSCIETRHAWCAARGVPYIHLIVPEKHVVYQDLVPEGMKPSPDRPLTRLLSAITGPARSAMIYPRALLQRKRITRETYLSNDTHWNRYGGFLAYEEMMRAAQRFLPVTALTEDDVRFVERRFVGDLGARFNPEKATQAPIAEHREPSAFRILYENKLFGRGNLTVYEGPDSGQPRAVLFRDSFSNYIIPHLIPSFSRLTVVGSPHMLYELLRTEKPDIVFFEMIERFLAFKLDAAGNKLLPQDLGQIDATEFLSISPREISTY